MTIPQLTGIIKFKVEGQSALPKWMQTALADALDKADAPPESLRFQCRIATDAQKNLALVKLASGETLTLHPIARPQFGKDNKGHAYLTATMTYSGDGENYTLRWIGDAVPSKMQEVAVKHDKGLAVSPTTIALDLSAAQVAPAWKVQNKPGPSALVRDHKAERARKKEIEAAGAVRKRGPRSCARLTDADLLSA